MNELKKQAPGQCLLSGCSAANQCCHFLPERKKCLHGRPKKLPTCQIFLYQKKRQESNKPKRAVYFITTVRTDMFNEVDWLDRLKDRKAAAKVMVRIERIRAGNLGTYRALGEGLHELKIPYGPGDRAYFGREGDRVATITGGISRKGRTTDGPWGKELARKLAKALRVDYRVFLQLLCFLAHQVHSRTGIECPVSKDLKSLSEIPKKKGVTRVSCNSLAFGTRGRT